MTNDMTHTKALRRLLELSDALASERGDRHVGVEHLLVTLYGHSSLMRSLLKGLGVDLPAAAGAIERLLASSGGSIMLPVERTGASSAGGPYQLLTIVSAGEPPRMRLSAEGAPLVAFWQDGELVTEEARGTVAQVAMDEFDRRSGSLPT